MYSELTNNDKSGYWEIADTAWHDTPNSQTDNDKGKNGEKAIALITALNQDRHYLKDHSHILVERENQNLVKTQIQMTVYLEMTNMIIFSPFMCDTPVCPIN